MEAMGPRLMRWLLDTNVLIDAYAGQPAAAKAMREARSKNAEWVGFSAITGLEILGFWRLTASDERGLRNLLAQFNEVPVTSEIIDEAIRVRRQGHMKSPDALVAGTALVCQAELVTRNLGDFSAIPGLTVVDPATL